MALESLLKKTASTPHSICFGCAIIHPDYVVEARRQLNECFARCMREGTPEITLPSLPLFIVAGAADPESTYLFFKDLRYKLGIVYFQDFYGTSAAYGKPDFLSRKHEQADTRFLRKMAKTSIFDSRATVDYRVAAFTHMLLSLRATLAILAKEPLMTDTGLYQPKYQLRSYIDQENLVVNKLSLLPNYTAKIRLLTGEHTIRTNPAPKLVTEPEIEARIRAIKERMLREGYTKAAAACDEEVRKRHEFLRRRPDDDTPPPLQTNSRRKR